MTDPYKKLTPQPDTIIVSRADYVRWNELWIAVERLAELWGDDGASGSALLEALQSSRDKVNHNGLNTHGGPISLTADAGR